VHSRLDVAHEARAPHLHSALGLEGPRAEIGGQGTRRRVDLALDPRAWSRRGTGSSSRSR
jgi:hypothetical protein